MEKHDAGALEVRARRARKRQRRFQAGLARVRVLQGPLKFDPETPVPSTTTTAPATRRVFGSDDRSIRSVPRLNFCASLRQLAQRPNNQKDERRSGKSSECFREK